MNDDSCCNPFSTLEVADDSDDEEGEACID